MNKRGLSLGNAGFIFIIVMVIMVLMFAQNGVDTTTINSTIEGLNWSRVNGNISQSIDIAKEGSPYYVQTIFEIAKKGVDFAGYTYFAVAKLAMQVALNNPDIINFKVLLLLLIFSLIAPVIYPTFLITISIFLIVKEWIKNRKEKRELKKYELRR